MENKTKLETIFDMFCDKEIEGKNRHFFHYKKNIFATNGISMIYCDESYLDFKTYNIILKEFILDNFLNIKTDLNILLNIDKSIFDKFRKKNGIKYINCDVCDGSGEVEWNFKTYNKYFDCPKCDGEGRKDYKTNQKTFETNWGIFINESLFNIDSLYTLFEVKELMNEEVLLKYQEEKFFLFKIGFLNIVLMKKVFMEDFDFQNNSYFKLVNDSNKNEFNEILGFNYTF